MDPSGASGEHREDNPAEDEARVKAVREAVGDQVELMVDANCQMKLDAAVRWCKRFEPYNLMWFEEPIVHNDPHLLAQLRKQTSIPIAAGQWENFFKLADLVKQDAVDFLNIHVLSVGGFTMGMKAAAWPTPSICPSAMATTSISICTPRCPTAGAPKFTSTTGLPRTPSTKICRGR